MYTIIAGCRQVSALGYPKRPLLYTEIQWILDQIDGFHQKNPITEVVSGRATGVDRVGEIWASHRGIPIKFFPAEWSKHGKAAGPIRNRQMGEYANNLLAFWDKISTGTKNMIETMKELEKPYEVVSLTYNFTPEKKDDM